MKKIKIAILIIAIPIITIIVAAFIIILLSLYHYNKGFKVLERGWKICQQTNTTWESDDGTIHFYVEAEDRILSITGTMKVKEDVLEIEIVDGPETSTMLTIYQPSEEERTQGVCYERWSCSYKAEDKIVVKISDSVFDRKGEKIILYRIDDSKE